MDRLRDFLSPEAGQKRREWLEDTIDKPLNYFLGPTGIPNRMKAINEVLNPVRGIEDAGTASQAMMDPNASTMDRVGAGGRMLSEVAGAVAPVAAGRMAGLGTDDMARAGMEAYTGLSTAPSAVAGRDFAMDESGAAKFKREMRDYHHGQSDETLRIMEESAPVGRIDYSVYEGRPAIQMIEISPEFRRQGYASEGLKELQRTFPDQEIDWGSLTSDGSKLYEKTRFVDVDQTGGIAQILPEIEKRYQEAERLYLDTFKDGFNGDPAAVREAFYKADDEYEAAKSMLNRPAKRLIDLQAQAAEQPLGSYLGQ